ncbi:hypothetical protein Tco_0487346 [Tanacetum coccineum]
MDQRMSTPTQLKWLPKLMGFDFKIVYKKGVDNVTADALSRLQNPVELLSIISTSTITIDLYNRVGHYTWHSQQLRRKEENEKGFEVIVRNCEICQRPFKEIYRKAPPIHIPYIGGESKVEMVNKTLSEREATMKTTEFHISRAQSKMKSHADNRRTDKQFDYGD